MLPAKRALKGAQALSGQAHCSLLVGHSRPPQRNQPCPLQVQLRRWSVCGARGCQVRKGCIPSPRPALCAAASVPWAGAARLLFMDQRNKIGKGMLRSRSRSRGVYPALTCVHAGMSMPTALASKLWSSSWPGVRARTRGKTGRTHYRIWCMGVATALGPIEHTTRCRPSCSTI